MSDARYVRNAGSVFALKYHFVWCPKCRRKVLVGEVAKELRSRLPSLWNRSYYVGTIGHVSEETVRHYIEMQKSR